MLALGFLFLLFAGVAMLTLGLRGRLVNRHPHCRKCRFDLVGVWDLPMAVQCPECGQVFRDEYSHRVSNGRRKARPGLIALGSALLLLALTLAASVTVASGPGITPRLPFAVLRFQASQARGTKQDAALVELIRRLEAQRLKQAQVNAIVGRALEIQGDPRAAWNVRWGDFVESAHERGLVSPDDAVRYVHQSVAGMDLAVYSPHLSGQSIFPSDTQKAGFSQEIKAGTTVDRMYMSIRPVRLAIDGVEVGILDLAEQEAERPMTTGQGSFVPGQMRWRHERLVPQWSPVSTSRVSCFPAIHASPGKHQLVMRILFQPTYSMLSMDVPPFEIAYELEIEVVDDPRQWIRMVDRTIEPEGYDGGQQVERVQLTVYTPQDDPTGVLLRVDFTPRTAFRPHAVAGRIVLKDSEGRVYGTQIRPVLLTRDQRPVYTGVSLTAEEWQQLRQYQTVDVMIEPDYTLVVPLIFPGWESSGRWRHFPSSVSPPSFWNDVIVFEDVPLETSPTP